jgi:hypothetical protein
MAGWLTVNEMGGLLKDTILAIPWSDDNHEHNIRTGIHAEIQIPNLQSTNNGKLLYRNILPTTSSQTTFRHKNSAITSLNIYGYNSSTWLPLVITHLHLGVHFLSEKYGSFSMNNHWMVYTTAKSLRNKNSCRNSREIELHTCHANMGERNAAC